MVRSLLAEHFISSSTTRRAAVLNEQALSHRRSRHPFNTVANSLVRGVILAGPWLTITARMVTSTLLLTSFRAARKQEQVLKQKSRTFLEALREQLRLKLESQKKAVEILILDHIEHLTTN